MASTDQNRPNILFILSDDQGPWAMNCSGTEELISPNLNRLSETGIRFENFFCASPVCSPARATILTGQMPSQHGVQDFLRSGNSEELSEEDKLTVFRARKIQRFLTQPFFVAETFTGQSGKYVPLRETVRGFQEILSGQHDSLPEQAFYMVGTIDEAVEKAAEMAAQG